LLATGGALPGPQGMAQKQQPSERQKGLRLGAIMVFSSMVMVPISIGLSILTDGPWPLLAPLTMFMTGVFWMLYARLFREPDLLAGQGSGQAVFSARRQMMLPSSSDLARGDLPSQIKTADISPPSVTEHTTNFLSNE